MICLMTDGTEDEIFLIISRGEGERKGKALLIFPFFFYTIAS